MKSPAVYTKTANKASEQNAYTKIAYHLQEARFHLEQISTTELAEGAGLKTRQSLQYRINEYKKEVANNGK